MRRVAFAVGLLLAAAAFGSMAGGGSAEASSHAFATTAEPGPLSTGPVLLTCAQRHTRIAALCRDKACLTRTSDAWDICEATGFWPARG